MATRLESFPSSCNKEKYNYDLWLDGSVWRLDKGSDFNLSPQAFRSMLWRAAYNRGLTIKTRIDHDSVIVKVTKKRRRDDVD